MAKEFSYRGKTVEELKGMSLNEFAELLPSMEKRRIKNGFTEEQKKFLRELKKGRGSLKTHCRDMIIIPEMIGKMVKVHKGNSFEAVRIEPEMIGHRLGEFALTRRKVNHSAPGIGATRSSASVSVR